MHGPRDNSCDNINEYKRGTKNDNINEENISDESITAKTVNTGKVDFADRSKENNSYKPYAIIGIVILTLVICAVFAIKKKHKNNYLFVAFVAAVAILTVIFTDFRSAESYYSQSETTKDNTIGTVSMSIRCDILNGKATSEYIPADGCILEMTEFDIAEGETAYDILIEAAKKYGISVEHKGGSDIVYISGINYLYELDYGDLSGWVYKVNNELPSVGCAGYKLKDSDVIEWCYTLDLGNDCID